MDTVARAATTSATVVADEEAQVQPTTTRTNPPQRDATRFRSWLPEALTRALAHETDPRHAPLVVVARDARRRGQDLIWTGHGSVQELARSVRPALRRLGDPWLVAVDRGERPRGCLRWATDRYVDCDEDPPGWHRHGTWYAEARSAGTAVVRAGHAFAEHADEEVLLAARATPPDDLGRVAWIRLALRGHPTRRHRPLR